MSAFGQGRWKRPVAGKQVVWRAGRLLIHGTHNHTTRAERFQDKRARLSGSQMRQTKTPSPGFDATKTGLVRAKSAKAIGVNLMVRV